MVEGEPEVEIMTKVEYIYKDTKASTGVEQDYKWGEIYRKLVEGKSYGLGLSSTLTPG